MKPIRQSLKYIISAFFLMSCQSFAPKDESDLDLVFRRQIQMGTEVTLALPRESAESLSAGFKIITELESRISSYISDSEVSMLNRRGHGRLSENSSQLLERSLQWAKGTDGAFDPTVGRLTLDAYRFEQNHGRKPNPEELKRALSTVGWSRISRKDGEWYLGASQWLDFGAIGKGYAVDQVAEYWSQQGLRRGIIAASGDIRCLHRCVMTIDGVVTFRAAKENLALSTSGESERRVPGTQLHHVLDPRRGLSTSEIRSVSVLSQADNTQVDAMTTALMVMGFKKAREFLKENPELAVILRTDQAIWVNQRFFELAEKVQWLTASPPQAL